MDDDNIKELLFQLGATLHKHHYTGGRNTTRWLNVSCPFAPFTHGKKSDNNPSFGITLNDEGPSYYKCFSCGVKGSLATLPARLGGYRKKDYTKLARWAANVELQAKTHRPWRPWAEDQEVYETEDDKGAGNRNLPDAGALQRYPSALGLPYLREARGITWQTTLLLGLRYDDFQRRILFPCYHPDDSFAGFTGRSTLPVSRLSKGNPKIRDYYGLDKRKLFLGLPSKYRSGPNLISEGLFDFAKQVQAGFRGSRSILGTALTPEKIDILIDAGEPVLFFMDNDRAGWNSLFGIFDEDNELNTSNAWAFKLYNELPVWIVPYPTPFDGTDPGSMTEKAIKAAVKRAWLFTGKVPMSDNGEPNLMPI